MALEFAPLMGPVARHLFGDPNPALSSEKEWRYGARGSLSIDLQKGTWFDHEIEQGGGVLELVARETQLTGLDRLEWMKAKGFVYETHEGGGNGASPRQRTIVATYDYRDEGDTLLFQVCRLEPKDFRQRRPDGKGDWVWSVKGIKHVPYRLPELVEYLNQVVFIVEGEKDVDRLWNIGIPATTGPGGAGKWRNELNDYFRGADVVLLPDYDPQKTNPNGEPLFHPDGRPVLPGQDHAQMVAKALSEIANRVRVLELWRDWPEMPLKGDISNWLDHGGTAERLYALAEQCPDWDPDAPLDTPLPVPIRSAFPIEEKSIPIRDWIVPGLLLRRNLSVLIAPPASGKSLLTLQLAIAITLGMPWGGWFPRAPEKVLVINAEDDYDEMRRRLCAAAKDMEVDQSQLVDRILLADAPEDIVICKMDYRTKSVIRTPLIEKLVSTINQSGVGVTIADPFAETFEGDENSNSEVKWAGILWREVARRTASSLMLVHHTKKYAHDMAGNADASRGGGALIGTARIMSTLFNMTEEEAKTFDIPVDDRIGYVRFDDAKSNHSAKGLVKWFKKQTVILDNGKPPFSGDEVGVLSPWKPPGLMENVAMPDIGLVLDAIARGVLADDGRPTGQLFSPAPNNDRYVGKVVELKLGASEEKAKEIIKTWLTNGVLEIVDYQDPTQRKQRKGVRVVQDKRPDQRAEVFS